MSGPEPISRPEFLETLGRALAQTRADLESLVSEGSGRVDADLRHLQERLKLAQETLSRLQAEFDRLRAGSGEHQEQVDSRLRDISREIHERLGQELDSLISLANSQNESISAFRVQTDQKLKSRDVVVQEFVGRLEETISAVTVIGEGLRGIEGHIARMGEGIRSSGETTTEAVEALQEAQDRIREELAVSRDQTFAATEAVEQLSEETGRHACRLDSHQEVLEDQARCLDEIGENQTAVSAGLREELEDMSTRFFQEVESATGLIAELRGQCDALVRGEESGKKAVQVIQERVATISREIGELDFPDYLKVDEFDRLHGELAESLEALSDSIAKSWSEATARTTGLSERVDLAHEVHDDMVKRYDKALDQVSDQIRNMGQEIRRTEDTLLDNLLARYGDVEEWQQGGPAYRKYSTVRHHGGMYLARSVTREEPGTSDDWVVVVNGVRDRGVEYREIDGVPSVEIWLTDTYGQRVSDAIQIPPPRYRKGFKKGTHYESGDVVTEDGCTYLCFRAGTYDTVHEGGWILQGMRGSRGPKGPIGLRGPQGPAVPLETISRQIEAILDDREGVPFRSYRGHWEYDTSYTTGDVVTLGQMLWIALQENDGKNAPNAAATRQWALILDAGNGGGGGEGGGGSLVAVTENDSTPGYLHDKVQSGDASVIFTVINPGGDEILDLQATGAGGGESNIGQNVGAGAQAYRDKTGVALNFRTLVDTARITWTQGADTLEATVPDGVFDPAGSAAAVQANLETHADGAGPHSGHLIAVQAGTGISVDNTDSQRPVVSATGGGGGGHTIQDEGTPLTQRGNLNFVGDGVTATDDSGNDATVVTISGGGGGGLTQVAIAPTTGDTPLAWGNHYLVDVSGLLTGGATVTLPAHQAGGRLRISLLNNAPLVMGDELYVRFNDTNLWSELFLQNESVEFESDGTNLVIQDGRIAQIAEIALSATTAQQFSAGWTYVTMDETWSQRGFIVDYPYLRPRRENTFDTTAFLSLSDSPANVLIYGNGGIGTFASYVWQDPATRTVLFIKGTHSAFLLGKDYTFGNRVYFASGGPYNLYNPDVSRQPKLIVQEVL